MHATPINSELLDFLTMLNDARSIDRAWGATVGFMRGLGASNLNLGMDPDGPDALLRWTSPRWIREMYLEEVYPDHDPKLTHCRNNVTPYLFGKAFWHLNPNGPARRRRFDEELVNAGTRSIVAFPVHMPASRSWGYVSIHTDQCADEFNRFCASHGTTLHLAGTMAFNRMRSLVIEDKASNVALTESERECLLWLSRGLREREIADRIGIRTVAVRRHLTNARHKLDSQTLDQALVKAVQLGLIEP